MTSHTVNVQNAMVKTKPYHIIYKAIVILVFLLRIGIVDNMKKSCYCNDVIVCINRPAAGYLVLGERVSIVRVGRRCVEDFKFDLCSWSGV